MKLSEYIETLTDEEKEKFKDLIEECKLREQKIDECSIERSKKLQTLVESEHNLIQLLNILNVSSNKLLQEVSKVYLQGININTKKQ